MENDYALMWFREDLRVADNTALYSACQASQHVFALYVIDVEAWQQHDVAACKVEFILNNLKALQANLAVHGIPLLVYQISQSKQIFQLFKQIVGALKIDAVYFNDQYEIDEHRRDQKLALDLKEHSIKVHHFTDQVIFGPGEILTKQNTPYTVFTPYKKAFVSKWLEHNAVLPLPDLHFNQQTDLKKFLSLDFDGAKYCQEIPGDIPGFLNNVEMKLWPAGEVSAHKRLENFIVEKIHLYHINRDYPALHGTSIISPYLAMGVLSPRQCFAAALSANDGQVFEGAQGVVCWLNELIWREFYKQILWSFPRVSMHQPFKEATQKIKWDNSLEIFKAWCDGCTGFPIVDAAMRQLKQTGWMHNRLRMIVAMFLTKDCFIDWRWGEKYFMQHLIDGDLAANNGGWQWSASTGTDAAPYFRIFNPILQSEKFDPQGVFIKHYCPELKELPANFIHDPAKIPVEINYPKAIIDRRKGKERVLLAFKSL